MIGHGRWERRVDLLAAGALDGSERAETLAHASSCPRCRARRAEVEAVLALVADDPVRRAPAPVPLDALVTRVRARLDAPVPSPAAGRWPAWAAAAAALLALVALLPRPAVVPPPAAAEVEEEEAAPLLEQMERTVRREQAARYLSEAQDLLVTVAGPSERCPRREEHVDVGEEARRSKALLARRAMVADLSEPEAGGAYPVMEEVEHVLREVAALESCVRRGDLEALEREIARRRLLIRIDLAARELMG
ncbi:MAG TPA: zf-HC2 domain-containing protein [Vicinamibacteria bacterium]|jgi:hypothetical protein